MIIKVAVTSVLIACAGCGIYRHGGVNAEIPAQPNSAINTIIEMPTDAVLIDQACSEYDACRSTAHGLGV